MEKRTRFCNLLATEPRPFKNSLGGRRGIRTPGASQLNGFQDRRNRPLCHPSVRKGKMLIRFYQIPWIRNRIRVDKNSLNHVGNLLYKDIKKSRRGHLPFRLLIVMRMCKLFQLIGHGCWLTCRTVYGHGCIPCSQL